MVLSTISDEEEDTEARADLHELNQVIRCYIFLIYLL